MNPSILIVDDEPQIRRVLRTTLAGAGYAIAEAGDGEEALAVLGRERMDLVLLDMNLPGLDGLETCRRIRTASGVPIIVLTVRNSERDKVRALDAGADDYVAKPFGFPELLARIRAALRRQSLADHGPPPVNTPELAIDFERRSVTAGGQPVHLAPKEFDLLRVLAGAEGRPVTHRKLLQAVWGPEYGDEAEYLRVAINQLRRKLEPNPRQPRFLLTEHRVGYRFVVPTK